MKPISPVVEGFEQLEVVFAKNQSEYLPLPALPINGNKQIITRWRLEWKERLRLLFGGDLYLWVSHFGKQLQPILPTTNKPELAKETTPCAY